MDPDGGLVTGRIAWGLWGVCAVLTVVGVVLLAASGSTSDAALPVLFLAFTTVGALLAAKRPENAIGWIFLGCGTAIVLNSVALGYAQGGIDGSTVDRPGAVGAAWLSQWIWSPAVGVLACFLLLLFPTGHLLSRRWLIVAWLAAAATAIDAAGRALAPGPLQDFPGIENPLGIGRVGGTFDTLVKQQAGSILILLVSAASLVSLALRFHRARSVEREQLKWFLMAAALLCLGFVVLAVTNGGSIGWIVWLAGILALPIATAIAILRYRLYDIDRLISRTLSYALLTGLLVGVFVGLVLLTTRVLPFSSPVGVAASTLAAAALFSPLRERLQRLVDRRFNRARYDAEATVAAFGARLRDAVDPETVLSELAAAAGELPRALSRQRLGQGVVNGRRLAVLLGALAALLIAASVPLSALAHQLSFGAVGQPLLMIPFAAVGTLVASRQPRNPIGWLLLAIAITATGGADAGYYAVRAYHIDHHGLPLSRFAVFFTQGWVSMLVLLPLPILFFPDGKISRPWRWTLGVVRRAHGGAPRASSRARISAHSPTAWSGSTPPAS